MSLAAETPFPPIETALPEPNGLLAAGGDLSAQRLLAAYSAGIFPWYERGQPVLWWSPDPRAVLRPAEVHVARSLKKAMRQKACGLTMDKAFAQVIEACAKPRAGGTWITGEMQQAYGSLHSLGFAHSLEVWRDNTLVGGLYGVAIGRLFCGESMFSRETGTSRMAFVALCKLLELSSWPLLDCQLQNPHLESLGVTTISRAEFKRYLPAAPDKPPAAHDPLLPLPWADTRALAGALA